MRKQAGAYYFFSAQPQPARAGGPGFSFCMKQFLLVAFFSLAALLAQAQNTTWGFGLPITATLTNGVLTCTVTDPSQGVKTFGQSNVTQLRNADGVVGWSTSGGYGFATYDVNLHRWQSTGANVNTAITTLQSAYGVGAWATNNSYGYARYNPVRQQWAEDGANVSSQCVVSTNYGVVVWSTAGGGYGFATYDPQPAQWKTGGANGYSGITIVTQHGLVAWRTSSSYGAAAYNPVLHQWFTAGGADTFSEMACDNGVVAWLSPTRVAMAAFSPALRHWTTFGYAASVTAGTLQINDGTVGFTISQGVQSLGYRTTTDQWTSGQATELACALLPVAIPQSSFVYFYNLSVGASSYSIACGDGQTIARRVGWKQYASGGTYSPELAISNSATTTTCPASVQVVLAAASPQAAARLQLAPNPASGTVQAQLPAGTTHLRLLNPLGQTLWQASVTANAQYLVPLAGLAPGAYLLVAEGTGSPVSARLLVY